MAHRNAPLTPEGRRRLCQRVDAGRPVCHVAAEAGVARQTLAKWHARWLEDGENGLHDRSSRPVTCPNPTDSEARYILANAVETYTPMFRVHFGTGPDGVYNLSATAGVRVQ